MGCLQTNKKSQIYQSNPIKIQYGKYNQKWIKQLQNNNLKINIIIDSHGEADHPSFRQIQKDITRTFPQQKYLQDSEKLIQFKEVLKCFALTFPKIGYTQGINFIVGYLLLNKMSKQLCLNLITSLFTNRTMLYIGFYEDNFPLADLYCRLFWKILEKKDKQLHKCLKDINIPDQMWIFQWFLTLFIYSFPLQYIQEFFTYIFQQKKFSLLKISIGIILSLKFNILNLRKDQYQFIQLISNFKDFQKCSQLVMLDKIFTQANKIQEKIIFECLNQVKIESKIQNFYLNYFCSNQKQKKVIYKTFMNEYQHQNLEVSKSRDNTILMQSYKRNSIAVQILDEIFKQSIKRQLTSKKYKSNMGPVVAQSKFFNQNQDKKFWKSQNYIQKDIKIQDQTNFSIVKIVNLKEDKLNLRS